MGNLPAPHSVCRFHVIRGKVQTLVGGIFDTGATLTSLVAAVEMPRLGIDDVHCVPMAARAANNQTNWQRLTILEATLDGKRFHLPVVFGDDLPLNLIGRVGLTDLWKITSDPVASATRFDWIGIQKAAGGQTITEVWARYYGDMLNAGYSWSAWNRAGKPAIPDPPSIPPKLPAGP